jgi:hypothetical protein
LGPLTLGERVMRGRTLVVGLCLGTLLSLSPIAVASALAGAPEYKLCTVAQPAHAGKYASNTCSEASFVAAGGQKFEREGFPWSKAKKTFFRDRGTTTLLQALVNPSGSGGGPSEPAAVERTVECAEALGTGEMTGPKSENWVETFKECSVVKQTWKCTGGTGRKNHVVTDELEGTLVYLNAAHTRIGLRVKGLGPGGRIMAYGCPAADMSVAVFGEYLTEVKEDINTASKRAMTVSSAGPLGLQSPLYEEQAFSESQGKEVLERDDSLEACEKGEPPFPAGEKTEEECALLVGPAPAATPPITLTSVDSGLSRERFPIAFGAAVTRKGEAFLIETS